MFGGLEVGMMLRMGLIVVTGIKSNILKYEKCTKI